MELQLRKEREQVAVKQEITFEDIGEPEEDSDYDALEVTNNDLLEQIVLEEKENAEDEATGVAVNDNSLADEPEGNAYDDEAEDAEEQRHKK
jgi:hypothetical protein